MARVSAMTDALETLFREHRITASARTSPVVRTKPGELFAAHDLDLCVDDTKASLRLEIRTRWSRELDTLIDAIRQHGVGAQWMIVLPHLDAVRRAW